jgi:hypothetical protein
MEQPNKPQNLTLEQAALFTNKLNAEGEVTREKRQGWDIVEAYSKLHDMIDTGARFNEGSVKDFQSTITRNSPNLLRIQKGRYSYNPKKIKDTSWECKPFASPETIDARMKRLVQYLENYMKYKPEEPSQTYKVVEHAAEIMVDLIDIHPFSDGNGRTSRLLADGILISGGLNPMSEWLDPNKGTLNKRKQDFGMKMEYACRGYFPLILKFMAGRQRAKLEEAIVVIETNTQARVEAQESGELEEIIAKYDNLTDYELILTNEILTNPPPKLPMIKENPNLTLVGGE